MGEAPGQGVGPDDVEHGARQHAEPGPEDVGRKRHPGESETVIEQIEGKDGGEPRQRHDYCPVLFGESIEPTELFVAREPPSGGVSGEVSGDQKGEARPQGGGHTDQDDPEDGAE